MTDLSDLVEVVSQFTSQVARKLRDQCSAARAVHVFIATSPYRKSDPRHAPSATLPLRRASADMRVLIGAAARALRGVYRPGFNYLRAGVLLLDLQADGHGQATRDLFGPDTDLDAPQHGRAVLMSALDALNQRFGRNAVTVASATCRTGPSAHASRQARRSPRYTTRLDEIATAWA